MNGLPSRKRKQVGAEHGPNNYRHQTLNVVFTGVFKRDTVSHVGIFDRLCEALDL
jgi:hypothetical protein